MYLIADYMTFDGHVRPMNRAWMEMQNSPFLKMSFETCVKFLTNAAMTCEHEFKQTPSSDIVLGRVPQVGTGCFEILQQI